MIETRRTHLSLLWRERFPLKSQNLRNIRCGQLRLCIADLGSCILITRTQGISRRRARAYARVLVRRKERRMSSSLARTGPSAVAFASSRSRSGYHLVGCSLASALSALSMTLRDNRDQTPLDDTAPCPCAQGPQTAASVRR
jgi:hypothetical protein